MGYRRKAKLITLKFADPEYIGFECVVKSLPVKQFLKLAALQDSEEVEAVEALLQMFTRALVRWNLEDDDGRPVPTTYDAVAELDFDFVMDLIDRWTAAMGGVDEDLGKGSTSGQSFPEVSIPTELLSPSPVS
ncbi:hypothetical protein E1281_25895 [Actinomadura sp. KC345]|uniref:hypothetical protein n=1 Tax=Actinomadura sp. KC345 TaxID=2530371 RepID=UPI001051F349|nr:hypothetical protein [Actinomadura sp. KC345]TDC47637.1 hypothetical protein E1281_25895 [Actinomadura sp. KC345]